MDHYSRFGKQAIEDEKIDFIIKTPNVDQFNEFTGKLEKDDSWSLWNIDAKGKDHIVEKNLSSAFKIIEAAKKFLYNQMRVDF